MAAAEIIDADPAAEADAGAGGGASSARGGGSRFVINYQQPLDRFSRRGCPAFAAQPNSRAAGTGRWIAFATDPRLPLRLKALRTLTRTGVLGLMAVEEWTVQRPPGSDVEQAVVVVRQPAGDTYMDARLSSQGPMPERVFIDHFLKPLVETLNEMHNLGLTHGGIRPNNIYACKDQDRPVLGECVTVPPGYDQPAVFETIDRAAAHPLGRGDPTILDDIYALGVTSVYLLVGRATVTETDVKAILHKKLEKSSFAALTDTYKVPPSVVEVLRGMLQDDPRDRWNLSDIEGWFKGAANTRKIRLPQGAAWPVDFDGRNHFTARALSFTLGACPETMRVLEFLKGRAFKNWLSRGLGDEKLQAKVEEVYNQRKRAEVEKAADIVAVTCMQLHAYGPLHWKGVSVNPHGIGTMMVGMIHQEGLPELLAELIRSNLPISWLSLQPEADGFVAAHVLLSKAAGLASRSGWGFGIERAVYELCPTSRCLSPILGGRMVVSVEDLLPALDEVAQEAGTPFLPIDRHLVAFIMAHRKDFTLSLLEGIDSQEQTQRIIAALRILAFVESKLGIGPFPDLNRLFGNLLQPNIDAVLRPRRRKELARRAEQAIQKQNLSAILDIFQDREMFDKDRREFQEARFRFQSNASMIATLETAAPLIDQEAEFAGSKWAFYVSMMLSTAACASTVWFMM